MENETILKPTATFPVGKSSLYYEFKDDCILLQPIGWVAFTPDQLSTNDRVQKRFFQLCAPDQFPNETLVAAGVSHMTALGALVVLVKKLQEFRNKLVYIDTDGLEKDLTEFDKLGEGQYACNRHSNIIGILIQDDMEVISKYCLGSADREVTVICDNKHKKFCCNLLKFCLDNIHTTGADIRSELGPLFREMFLGHAQATGNYKSIAKEGRAIDDFVTYFCGVTRNYAYAINIKDKPSPDRTKYILTMQFDVDY